MGLTMGASQVRRSTLNRFPSPFNLQYPIAIHYTHKIFVAPWGLSSMRARARQMIVWRKEVAQMNNDSLVASPTIRRIGAIIAVTTLVLVWATTAHAQTSAGTQYGNPTDSGETAITQALDSSSGTDTGSGTAGTSDSSGTGVTGTTGTAGLTGLLPSTGGPLLPLALLCGLALSSAGLLLARRNSRQ